MDGQQGTQALSDGEVQALLETAGQAHATNAKDHSPPGAEDLERLIEWANEARREGRLNARILEMILVGRIFPLIEGERIAFAAVRSKESKTSRQTQGGAT